jgi:excisionase family DNA binding protein
MPKPVLYSLEEVAEIVHASRKTVYLWTLERKLASVKLGRHVLVREADLTAFVDGRERAAVAAPAAKPRSHRAGQR